MPDVRTSGLSKMDMVLTIRGFQVVGNKKIKDLVILHHEVSGRSNREHVRILKILTKNISGVSGTFPRTCE